MTEVATPQQQVHEALRAYLDEDEIAVGWCLVIDVVGTDGTRYLAHRSGGGFDGSENLQVWQALGMLRSSIITAEEQLGDCTQDVEDEDDD
jgi:hypothetical protein